MFSRFFIHRPIFASVLSILITLAGGIAVFTLPIAQYPEITPPTVQVSAFYPGADSKVVADTVAAPIEQQVNGVEGMLYMSSQCTNDGSYTLTITFQLGTNLNMAQVLVQNRVALAQPILPNLVQRLGVTVTKKSPSILMIVNLYSPDNTHDNLDLSTYATTQLRDELSRLKGVGDITYLGQRNYSMRLWLDPDKMAKLGLSASDILAAVQAQNIQVAAGQIGQPPVPTGQVFQYTMTTLGRLTDPEQFADMTLKTNVGGQGIVRMRDVARIEEGAQTYDQACTLDGRPSVALSVYQLPGTNAIKTAQDVRLKMEELKKRFPPGIDYSIVYDTTPFINESINEVFITLIDAIALVAFVVLLFLQNWRSAIIPLVAVPVAIIGTFAVMAAMGFSLNNLTLFGLVLAIGIVVDDAIVVVEAVEHHIEQGLAPREATIKAMSQVSSPVIAVGLVLAAVFVPCTFISGITGQFFRQFAMTIAVSTLISAFNSLTLSPALAAMLLKPKPHGAKADYEVLPRLAYPLLGALISFRFFSGKTTAWLTWLLPHIKHHGWLHSVLTASWAPAMVTILVGVSIGLIVTLFFHRAFNVALGSLFRAFNTSFTYSTGLYSRAVGRLLRLSLVVLLVYGGLLYATYRGFMASPSGFIPTQDKGYLLVNVQLPDAASVERTRQVMQRIENIAQQTDGVEHTVAIAGQSILLGANAPNFGALYVMLKDFHERNHRDLSGDAIAARLQKQFQDEIEEGMVQVFGAPPIDGLGTAGGFKLVIEDRGNAGLPALQAAGEKIAELGNQDKRLQGLYCSFRADTPWLFLDIDRLQAKTMGVSMAEVFNTLQVYLGSYYINDFNRFGRTWQVNAQADSTYRESTDSIKRLKVRNASGAMVPLGTFASIREISGPVMVQRYNMYPTAFINGQPTPGVSSGEALATLESVAKGVQADFQTMRPEWTELAFLQLQTGNTAMWVFLLAVILVFLVLAAQYESWSLPLAVILVVPMCLLCSLAGVAMAKMDVNIFTQIGFVVLVGLACKNAILIVEYARVQSSQGVPRFEATLEACKLRLRPIIMTSLAFILGVVPLMISVGAGAEMRQTLGTAVFAGMLGVTLFGIFLTPVFYYVIQWFQDLRGKNKP